MPPPPSLKGRAWFRLERMKAARQVVEITEYYGRMSLQLQVLCPLGPLSPVPRPSRGTGGKNTGRQQLLHSTKLNRHGRARITPNTRVGV